MPTAAEPPLIALVGITAVGKTALALRLAEQVDLEVIGADSRQVYRQMDIGTAKPSPAELAAVPHHLVSIIDPDEPFSLALYLAGALQAIGATQGRGRLPLLVGGTGQYLAALLEGWQLPDVPPHPELRRALEDEAKIGGVAPLYARLQRLDPAAAQAMHSANLRRIVRALEVISVTGQPFSAQQRRQPPPFRLLTIELTLPRDAAYARIDARVDAMLATGLLDEVRELRQRGYGWELPSMSSLGYIQFRPLLDGTGSCEACVQRLKWDTHTFARRQEQWFRRLPNRVVLPSDSPGLLNAALTAIMPIADSR